MAVKKAVAVLLVASLELDLGTKLRELYLRHGLPDKAAAFGDR